MTASERPRSVGRQRAGAATGQGRGARDPAAAPAASLDGAQEGAGYTRGERTSTRAPLDLDRIRHCVPLSKVLAHYGALSELKRVGGQLRGACPIHHGSNRSQFVVDLKANSWHCFGDCRAGGGTLELVAAREKVPLARAAEIIADWFALEASPRSTFVTTTARRRPMTINARPSHRAYVVEDREATSEDEQSGFWTRIGSAWPHKDGKGLSIVLSALPVNGRIVLRENTAEDEEREQRKAGQPRT